MDDLEELKCALCYDLFSRPVTLGCGHTFCSDCITSFYARQPKCPVCRQPILGSGRFQVNYAMQRLVDRVSGTTQQEGNPSAPRQPDQTGPQAEPRPVQPEPQVAEDAWIIDPTEHRLVGFDVVYSKGTYFFPHSAYKITISYPHPTEHFANFVPNSFFVALFKKGTQLRGAYLAKIEQIIKFTRTGVRVFARFSGRFRPVQIQSEELAVGDPPTPEHPHSSVHNITVQLVRGHTISRRPPQQISPSVETGLRHLEHWTNRVLGRLAHSNPQIAHEVVVKSGVEPRGSTLSIDWRINPFEFVERIASILVLSYPEKKVVGGTGALRNKVEVLTGLTNRIDPQADPIFILDPHFDQEPSLPWANLGFVLAVVFFIAAALFPRIRNALA